MRTSPNDPTSASLDADAVRSVALDYIEGWYHGDPDRMAESLHDDLVKRTPLANDDSGASDLRPVSKARMVELTRDGGGTDVADPMIKVFVDDLSDDIAQAHPLTIELRSR